MPLGLVPPNVAPTEHLHSFPLTVSFVRRPAAPSPFLFQFSHFPGKIQKTLWLERKAGKQKERKGRRDQERWERNKTECLFLLLSGCWHGLGSACSKACSLSQNPWINFLGLKKNPPHIRRRKTCFTSQPGYSKSAGKHLPTSPLRSANVELIKIKTIF